MPRPPSVCARLKQLAVRFLQADGLTLDHRGSADSRGKPVPAFRAYSPLEQLGGLWNILGAKPSVYGAIFSSFQAERQSNHQELWSGRWESNPRPKLGKLLYCHYTTPAPTAHRSEYH